VVRASRIGGGCLWPVSHLAGLMTATTGRWDDAVVHFETAMRLERRMGARPYLATTSYHHALALRERGGLGTTQQAARAMDKALASLRELGIRPLFSPLTLVQATIPAATTSTTAASVPAPAPAVAAVLCREGEYWTAAWQGVAFRLRDAIGLAHLTRLLATPGQELHALDLAAPAAAGGGRPAITADSGGGPVLDQQAKAAYRRRLQELADELAEAEAWDDSGRAARARAEWEALTAQLAAAVGLGGRDRTTGTSAERARVSVTKALRGTIRRIAEHNQAMGAHLDRNLRTGTFCAYVPDPATPVTWTLTPAADDRASTRRREPQDPR